MMVIIIISLYYRSIYVNVNLDLSLSFINRNLLKIISFNIKIHGYELLPSSEMITIIYQVYYMTIRNLISKVKYNIKPDKTTMVENKLSSSHVFVNKQIKWDKVNFLKSWMASNLISP